MYKGVVHTIHICRIRSLMYCSTLPETARAYILSYEYEQEVRMRMGNIHTAAYNKI